MSSPSPSTACTFPRSCLLSLPSSLVRQRPDIRAAESLLHQASANVGVATANLYPQIVLSGSGGRIGTSFTNGGDVWNVGASLAQPIFNGGALRAERRKAVAAYEEAGSVYQQTVLQAFREVADALRAIEHDAQALQARSRSGRSGRRAPTRSPRSATRRRHQPTRAARCAAPAIADCTGPDLSGAAATPTPRHCCRRWAEDGGTKNNLAERN